MLTSPIFSALLAAVVLTALLSAIELIYESKSNLGSIFTPESGLFFSIKLLGNIATTLAAKAYAPSLAADWYMQALVGVFGFEAAIRNLNISVRDKAALTISDWIQRAKNSASGAILKNEARIQLKREATLAERLRNLPLIELNSHVLTLLGPKLPTSLALKATSAGADERLVKAYALAQGAYKNASEIKC